MFYELDLDKHKEIAKSLNWDDLAEVIIELNSLLMYTEDEVFKSHYEKITEIYEDTKDKMVDELSTHPGLKIIDEGE